MKTKFNDITKLLRYKKKPKTDDVLFLEKKNRKKEEEIERENIDRDFVKSLNDKILKIEKNKKNYNQKMPSFTKKLLA